MNIEMIIISVQLYMGTCKKGWSEKTPVCVDGPYQFVVPDLEIFVHAHTYPRRIQICAL